ncbi:MAG: hypothetical protein HY200_05125 [Nitrospirae bacterium]|nr:hypothetical protein [Nitrospirota bacterium]
MTLFSSLKAGLHIGKDYLSFAILKQKRGGFEIQDFELIFLSKNAVRHSPTESNILSSQEIRDHLQKVFADRPEIKSISLSLPDLSSRMVLIEIKNEIPPLIELNQMIKWNMEQKFVTEIGESRFSHQLIGQSDKSFKNKAESGISKKYFLILGTAVLKNILAEYEGPLLSFQRIPKVINSASLNIFNLYHDLIFDQYKSENFLFLSVLDNYFTLMVFEKKILQYIRTVGLRSSEDGMEGKIDENNQLKIVNEIETALQYHYRDAELISEVQLYMTGLREIPNSVLDAAGRHHLKVLLLTPRLFPGLDRNELIRNGDMFQLSPAIAAAAGAII